MSIRFGIGADVDGYYRSSQTAHGKEKESEHRFTFGPHFALRKNKLVSFGYAFIGGATERTSLNGVGDSSPGFAAEFGGGVDLEVTHGIAIRLFDVAASVTHIDQETRTKPKVTFGLVFNFGRK